MMVAVRLWKPTDIDYVSSSVEKADWRHTKRDVERCWRFEPNGCFIAEINHKPVGHVFSVNYGKVGWIGLLIVNEEHRQKGIGALLMQTAMNYLRNVGCETIQLEAAEKAIPLYKRLGFVEEFSSLRFKKQLKKDEVFRFSVQSKTVGMRDEDVEATARFDSKFFGANRFRVLHSLYKDYPQLCFVEKERNHIVGYIMGRKITQAYQIGPWVCARENPQATKELFFVCLSAIGSSEIEVRIGVPAPNEMATKLMDKLGFKQVGKSTRMVWGKPRHEGDISGIFGIGGAEKG